MSKRIFIGFNNAAGYGTRLMKGFREIGIEADLYLQGSHPWGFDIPEARYVKYPKNIWLQRLYVRYFLVKCLLKYDAFIFISTDTMMKNFKDFKYYKFLHKKTLMIFTGCDILQPELTHKPHIPYSSCHECVQEFKDFVGCVPETKILRTRKLEKLVDVIMTDSVIADSLTRQYVQAIPPVYIEDYPKDIPEPQNEIPVILHAPSNPGYKGSKYIINAVEKLKSEFKFEFRLVQNVKLEELYEEISKADIVVDQMIQGWQGILPLEAMMYERPVICYLRDDVVKRLPKECPFINANPGTIYDVLREFLQAYSKNPEAYRRLGKVSRKYAEKYHDARKVAKMYADLLLN